MITQYLFGLVLSFSVNGETQIQIVDTYLDEEDCKAVLVENSPNVNLTCEVVGARLIQMGQPMPDKKEYSM